VHAAFVVLGLGGRRYLVRWFSHANPREAPLGGPVDARRMGSSFFRADCPGFQTAVAGRSFSLRQHGCQTRQEHLKGGGSESGTRRGDAKVACEAPKKSVWVWWVGFRASSRAQVFEKQTVDGPVEKAIWADGPEESQAAQAAGRLFGTDSPGNIGIDSSRKNWRV